MWLKILSKYSTKKAYQILIHLNLCNLCLHSIVLHSFSIHIFIPSVNVTHATCAFHVSLLFPPFSFHSIQFHSFHRFLPPFVQVRSFLHSFVCSFIHFVRFFRRSFIHPFIHSFNHSFIHSFIHSLTHPSIHSFIQSFIHLLIHWFHAFISFPVKSIIFIRSLNHWFILSCHSFNIHFLIHSFIHSFIHSLTHSFIHSFILSFHFISFQSFHPFIHSFIPFIHAFISFSHSFIHSVSHSFHAFMPSMPPCHPLPFIHSICSRFEPLSLHSFARATFHLPDLPVHFILSCLCTVESFAGLVLVPRPSHSNYGVSALFQSFRPGVRVPFTQTIANSY